MWKDLEDQYEDSQFRNLLIQDPPKHTIELNYKGPKWLLEEDKDFYMDAFECDIISPGRKDVYSHSNPELNAKKIYYIQFNPVKKYLTLYTKKFNTKNDEESSNQRTRG
ncbi:hypothetical protein ACMBCQ_01925 [Candidatus Phytoplasma citri]